MTNRIPQQFIDQVLTRIDIVDLIDSSVTLKKTGSNYSACCPFHQEKTPSFTVSPNKQFYHCFGCGASGNAISFLMNYEGLNFPEAIQNLAQIAGLEMPKETQNTDNFNAAPLYSILETATSYYQSQLKNHPHAIQYLKQRGLSGETAKRFGLGFAPSGWENIQTACKNASTTQLLQTGLLIQNDNHKTYDRFRNRIMFPIRDRRGRVIGFGGRVLDDATPKYLNSPETPVFHKGQSLYGLYEAKKLERQLTKIVIVEGYMDVLALAEHGIAYAVATLGTATTAEHIKQLCRHTDNLIFCFDGDHAGRQAAWRALETSLPLMDQATHVSFMFLPQGEDPDSFVKQQGKIAFEDHLQNALSLSEFFFEQLTKNIDIKTVDARARLHQTAMQYIDPLTQSYFKQSLLEALSQITRIKTKAPNLPKPQPIKKRHTTALKMPSPLRSLITLLLQHPQLAALCPNNFSQLQISGASFLEELVTTLKQNTNLSLGTLLEHWRDTPIASELQRLACAPLFIPENGLETECLDTIARLKAHSQEKEIEGFMAKAASPVGLNATEKEQLQKLLKAKTKTTDT